MSCLTTCCIPTSSQGSNINVLHLPTYPAWVPLAMPSTLICIHSLISNQLLPPPETLLWLSPSWVGYLSSFQLFFKNIPIIVPTTLYSIISLIPQLDLSWRLYPNAYHLVHNKCSISVFLVSSENANITMTKRRKHPTKKIWSNFHSGLTCIWHRRVPLHTTHTQSFPTHGQSRHLLERCTWKGGRKFPLTHSKIPYPWAAVLLRRPPQIANI